MLSFASAALGVSAVMTTVSGHIIVATGVGSPSVVHMAVVYCLSWMMSTGVGHRSIASAVTVVVPLEWTLREGPGINAVSPAGVPMSGCVG